MSTFIPSTTVSIQRGEDVDSFGDPVDSPTTIAECVPCLVTEGVRGARHQQTFAPNTQRGGVIEVFTLRFRPGVSLEEQDRVLDERNGHVFTVVNVFHSQSVVGAADVRAEAIRTAAKSRPIASQEEVF